MSRRQRFQSVSLAHERPSWEPLLGLVGTDLAGWFMWMGEVELSDGSNVHVYKHRDTRRSIHVGVDGRTFVYDWDGGSGVGADGYIECTREEAITAAFAQWRSLSARMRDEVMDAVDEARALARDGFTFAVDPKELELQREYEAKQDLAA